MTDVENSKTQNCIYVIHFYIHCSFYVYIYTYIHCSSYIYISIYMQTFLYIENFYMYKKGNVFKIWQFLLG